MRFLNLVLILALLSVYQHVSVSRAEKESAALEEAQAFAAEQRAASGAASVYRDGTFTGTAKGYGGMITVEVTIEKDRIISIEPVSHSGEGSAYWGMASAMIPEMIQMQSPNVDAVSGATFTSTGIHNAVTQALQQAVTEQ